MTIGQQCCRRCGWEIDSISIAITPSSMGKTIPRNERRTRCSRISAGRRHNIRCTRDSVVIATQGSEPRRRMHVSIRRWHSFFLWLRWRRNVYFLILLACMLIRSGNYNMKFRRRQSGGYRRRRRICRRNDVSNRRCR